MLRVGVLGLALVALALAGCDEGEEFSEKRVLEAAGVKDGSVGGDPFCQVDEALASADAVETAEGKADGNIITSKRGNVGVVVVPPFPDDCARQVRKGLDKLDREPK